MRIDAHLDLVQRSKEGCLVLPFSRQIETRNYSVPSTLSLMRFINKTLANMATDVLKAKLSYSSIIKKITLHMTRAPLGDWLSTSTPTLTTDLYTGVEINKFNPLARGTSSLDVMVGQCGGSAE